MIGYGDSCPKLHAMLKRCQVCRIYAIFHDAMGFLYKTHDVGNGYDILMGCFPACPLAGQVSERLYWTCQYFKNNYEIV